jgi:hypothetical protein
MKDRSKASDSWGNTETVVTTDDDGEWKAEVTGEAVVKAEKEG